MKIDLRPIASVCGLLVALLGLTMLIPLGLDLFDQDPNAFAFGISSLIAVFSGSAIAMASRQLNPERLSIQQTFLLTTMIWFILPIFGALPFIFGTPNARIVDAFF